MRLHELAKEMEADSKELLALAKKLGLPIKSHSSNLAPGETALLRVGFRFRDLDEDELFDKLENLEEEKKAEDEQREAEEKERRAEIARKRVEERELAEKEEDEVGVEVGAELDADETQSFESDADAESEPEPVEALSEETPEAPAEVEPASVAVEPIEAEAPAIEDAATTEAAAPTAEPVARGTTSSSASAPSAPSAAPSQSGPATPGTSKSAPAASAPVKAAASAQGPLGKAQNPVTPPAGEAEGDEPKRRGAKILGRIELDTEQVQKAEATHDQLDRNLGNATPGSARRYGQRTGTEADRQRSRRRTPTGGKQSKSWQNEAVESSGPGMESMARVWERMPHLKRAQPPAPRRSIGRRSRGPKKNPLVDKKITVIPPLSIKDFSQETGIRANDILGKLLMSQGKAFTINSMLDEELVMALAVDFNRDIDTAERRTAEMDLMDREEAQAGGKKADTNQTSGPDARPPVVVLMGHVDHGKTSLLDAIRESKVADGEAGGITQGVSAYQVKTKTGNTVTFLDTPGHRAFTEMRARGANCTDVVVLVVAADDGVMPQTEEAFQHARAAGESLPIVVALNKIDKPEADALKAKQGLMTLGLLPEDFGGETAVIETSASTGQGIDELLERLALEAEIGELSADNKRRGVAYVLEASKQEGKGVVATVLVRDGTLKVRDPFLCGNTWGRVRMMEDHTGKRLKEAPPSTPVRVYGFKGDMPEAGDMLMAVATEREAEKVAVERQRAVIEDAEPDRQAVTLENLFESLEAKQVSEIKVVLKTDFQGSLQVLKREFEALKHAEVEVRLLRSGVGGITEDDVILASTSDAIMIGFGVTAEGKARREADRLGVEIRTYKVIYELLDDLKAAMAGALKPEEIEKIAGHVEVRQVFKVSRLGTIAGCYVTDGVIRRSDKVRVIRDGKMIYDTTLDSLKRFKDDAKEVKENFECGLKLAGFDDVKVGDTLEAYHIIYKERELEFE